MENTGKGAFGATDAPETTTTSASGPTTSIIDPIAPRKIVSSADLAPPAPEPTPLSSAKPRFTSTPTPAPTPSSTQTPTQASTPPADNGNLAQPRFTPPSTSAPPADNGDIILRPTPSRKKPSKKLIIGLAAGAAVLIASLATLLTLSSSEDEKATKLLQANSSAIETVENLLERIQLGEVVTSDLMDEATHTELNQAIPQFLNFEAEFAKINPTKVTSSARGNLEQLQSTFSRQAKNLKPTLELYNISYMIYSTDDSEPIKPYLENENPTVVAVAERLKEYAEHKKQLTNDLKAKDCSLTATGQSEACAMLVEEYDTVVDTMRWSFAVPQAIFFAYDTSMTDTDAVTASYEEIVATIPRVKQTIEELK